MNCLRLCTVFFLSLSATQAWSFNLGKELSNVRNIVTNTAKRIANEGGKVVGKVVKESDNAVQDVVKAGDQAAGEVTGRNAARRTNEARKKAAEAEKARKRTECLSQREIAILNAQNKINLIKLERKQALQGLQIDKTKLEQLRGTQDKLSEIARIVDTLLEQWKRSDQMDAEVVATIDHLQREMGQSKGSKERLIEWAKNLKLILSEPDHGSSNGDIELLVGQIELIVDINHTKSMEKMVEEIENVSNKKKYDLILKATALVEDSISEQINDIDLWVEEQELKIEGYDDLGVSKRLESAEKKLAAATLTSC